MQPKHTLNYTNTCIYKITCKDPAVTGVYVGCTVNFKKRKAEHISNCTNQNTKMHNYKLYRYVRDHNGFDNFTIEPILKVNCEDRLDAARYERKYCELLGADLNQQVPSRTKQGWYRDNVEQRLQYQNEYSKRNSDTIKQKQNTPNNCDCGGAFTYANKASHIRSNKHQKFVADQNQTE